MSDEQLIRADEIRPGDVLDLEGDPFFDSDPEGDTHWLQFEGAEVLDVDRETAEVIAIYPSGVGGYAVAADHLFKVMHRREPDTDAA